MKKFIIHYVAILTLLLMSSCQAAPGAHSTAYVSQQSLVKQAELYGQIYDQEGDAYVAGNMETYRACQQLLQTMDRLATEEYGKARWQVARDRVTKRIDKFHEAHPE